MQEVSDEGTNNRRYPGFYTNTPSVYSFKQYQVEPIASNDTVKINVKSKNLVKRRNAFYDDCA